MFCLWYAGPIVAHNDCGTIGLLLKLYVGLRAIFECVGNEIIECAFEREGLTGYDDGFVGCFIGNGSTEIQVLVTDGAEERVKFKLNDWFVLDLNFCVCKNLRAHIFHFIEIMICFFRLHLITDELGA